MSLLTTIASWGITQSLAMQVAAILRKYGTDAHVYLPGIGVINGLTAGNYLDSAGTTAATVDNPVGLVLDAAGSVGSELVTNGNFSVGTGWTLGAGWTISGGNAVYGGAGNGNLNQNISATTGKFYKVEFTIVSITGGVRVGLGGITYTSFYTTTGQKTIYINKTDGNALLYFQVQAAGNLISIDNVSVKEVTGIHALQATTANKPILRQESFGYSWQFDSTDVLVSTTGTFGADMDCFMGLYADVSKDAAALFNAPLGSSFFGVWQSAATVSHLSSGSPTYKVNGVSVTGGSSVTRSQLKAAIPNNTFCVFEANNLNMSSGWSSFSLGRLVDDYYLIGKYSIVVLIPALSESDRLIMRKFVGLFTGVSI